MVFCLFLVLRDGKDVIPGDGRTWTEGEAVRAVPCLSPFCAVVVLRDPVTGAMSF